MGKVKKRVKMLVSEADAAYILREGIKTKALKITKALI